MHWTLELRDCSRMFQSLLILLVQNGPFGLGHSGLFPSKLNPCTFPTPSEPYFAEKCQITDPHVKRYNICDPESAVSMSEVFEIVEELDKTYLEKDKEYGQSCICDEDPHKRCWYKFGFAFLKEMSLSYHQLPPNIGTKFCERNRTDTGKSFDSADSVHKFGNQYAQIVRTRWKQGVCGEDVLFLIVTKRPQMVIFVSMGSTVRERSNHLYIPHLQKKTLGHIVENINEKFEKNGLTLKPAYEHLIEEYVKMLSLADQTYYKPKRRNHIPTWALASFGGCALLLAIMAIGLFLAKTRVRRGAPRKPGAETNRRWKAGFVGGQHEHPHRDDAENENKNCALSVHMIIPRSRTDWNEISRTTTRI